jgi:alpha-tubulin suppressor-like RCC1 family protein
VTSLVNIVQLLVASWGVGKRGQLGHGKREDHKDPKLMMGGIGYGIRIVQVAAGGGLVRVAHSLLLTSHGKVLSFGTGQYGALGATCLCKEMNPTARCCTNTSFLRLS